MNRHLSLKQTLTSIGTSVVLAASASGLVLSQSAVALNTHSIQPAATTNQQQSKLLLASGRTGV